MKRGSYKSAVVWIANEDEPLERDPEKIAQFTTALLVADLFEVTPLQVGTDVARYRRMNHAPLPKEGT